MTTETNVVKRPTLRLGGSKVKVTVDVPLQTTEPMKPPIICLFDVVVPSTSTFHPLWNRSVVASIQPEQCLGC